MKKIFKSLIGLLLLLFIIGAGLSYMQPNNYKIMESVEINKSAKIIFPMISDLKLWKSWSPWIAKDSNMKLNYSKDSAGVGAFVEWDSETQGSGKQTVLDIVDDEVIKIELEFYKPWAGGALTFFKIKSLGGHKTKVSWMFEGENKTLLEKFFYKVLNFKASISEDYKQGLINLKNHAENIKQ